MMPNSPPTLFPPETPAPEPANKPEVDAAPAPAIATGENPHVDYNLQKLKVESLEHYIDQPGGSERFRVS